MAAADLVILPVGTLSLAQRRELEAIAWNVGVVEPDGEFNCQNWAAAVLAVAAARGLIEERVCHDLLSNALKDDPASSKLSLTGC